MGRSRKKGQCAGVDRHWNDKLLFIEVTQEAKASLV